jgi:hypothetical protein
MNYEYVEGVIVQAKPDACSEIGIAIGLILTLDINGRLVICIGCHDWTQENELKIKELPALIGKKISCVFCVISQSSQAKISETKAKSFIQESEYMAKVNGPLVDIVEMPTELPGITSKHYLIDCGLPVYLEHSKDIEGVELGEYLEDMGILDIVTVKLW